jgi:hypothetical protein
MLVLFLTGLCMTGALTVGLVFVMDQRHGKGDDRQVEQQSATSGEPAPPPTPAIGHPLSERRIADESRKLVEEIEHFLADPRSS